MQGAHGARQRLVVFADPFQRKPCAPGNEGCGIRLFAHDLRRRAARPRAIGVGPDHLRGVARLERTHGGNLEGGTLVHRDGAFYAAGHRPEGREGASRRPCVVGASY